MGEHMSAAWEMPGSQAINVHVWNSFIIFDKILRLVCAGLEMDSCDHSGSESEPEPEPETLSESGEIDRREVLQVGDLAEESLQ